MSSSMMSLELMSSIRIDSHSHFLSFEHLNISFKRSVNDMQNTFSNLDCINYFVWSCTTSNFDGTSVVLLPSWCRIYSWFVKYQNVWKHVLFDVFENFNDFGLKTHSWMILIVQVFCLR
jgi:hypothetical protein